ncbi:MAG: diguanylate cyclase [Leptospiraceae bacterium]|nr:diguanylate cyclase [Leptospiraceae bacterium]
MTKEELLGQKICEIFPINLKNGFFENYKRCYETQKLSKYEYEVSAEYSTPGWYEQQIIPLRKGLGVFTRNLTFKKKTESELLESLAYIEAINNSIPGILFVINIETDEVVYVNKGVKTILGYSSWTFFDVGLHFILNLIHPDDKNFYVQEISRIKRKLFSSNPSTEKTFILEYRMSTIDGDWKYFRNFITRFKLGDERKLILIISLEVTKEQEIRNQLYQREKDFEAILNNMPDLIARFNTNGFCTYVNKALNYIFNISEREVIGKSLNELPLSEKNKKEIAEAFSKVMQTKNKYDVVLDFEFNSELKYFQTRLIPELDDSELLKSILLISWDITEIKNAEEQLYQNIFHDSLTSLTNRRYFLAKLEEAISQATEKTSFGVMFIDVDRFQELNDSLGHLVADKLLKVISERISRVLPKDTIFSRLGGDEFGILLKTEANIIKTFLASISLEIFITVTPVSESPSIIAV